MARHHYDLSKTTVIRTLKVRHHPYWQGMGKGVQLGLRVTSQGAVWHGKVRRDGLTRQRSLGEHTQGFGYKEARAALDAPVMRSSQRPSSASSRRCAIAIDASRPPWKFFQTSLGSSAASRDALRHERLCN